MTELLYLWLLWLPYAFSAIVAIVIAASLHQHLSYWPSANILAIGYGIQGLNYSIYRFPMLDPEWMALMRSNGWQLTLSLGMLAFGLWALAIIIKQNKVGVNGIVGPDGHTYHVTIGQVKRRIRDNMKLVSGLETQ